MTWRTIETAPAGERVLLWFPDLGYPVTGTAEAYGYKTGGWKATHWLPLPPPPSTPCKHEHGSGIMDTNGNGEFTCHDCGDVLVLGRGFQPQQLVTLRPDEAENWECPRCNSLTSTMLTRCYVCATPRGAV